MHKTISHDVDDSDIVCKGCSQDVSPSKHSSNRNNWIECNKCGNWWHINCAGISSQDSDNFEQFDIKYTCAVCVFNSLKCVEKSTFIDCGSPHVEKKIDKLITVTSILTEEVTKEKSGSANNSEIKPVKLSSAIGKSDYFKDNIIVGDNISSPKDYQSSKQIKVS